MHDDADDTQDVEGPAILPDAPAEERTDAETAMDGTSPDTTSPDTTVPDTAVPDTTDGEPTDAGTQVDDLSGGDADDGPAPAPPIAELRAPDESGSSMEDLAARAEAEGTSMMALLLEEGDFLPSRYQRGDVVEGAVVSKSRDQLTVNLGAKQEAVVPASDIARVPKAVWDAVQPGDTIQLVVMRPDGRDGEIVLSLSQALTGEDWTRAEELLENGQVVELEIVGFNRGGLLVGFGGLQGFIPRSQMARPMPEGGPERMAEFVGERIVVKVVEVSRAKRRLIMSERQAAREWRSERKRQLLGDLNEGDVRRGRVTSIAEFGAFIDLGGADGLVHVSEMSFDRNRRPSDIVKIGDEVDVQVLSIDRERKRISLSMKRLLKDPWAIAAEEHYVGELVDGVVVNMADFGAFVRLQDHLEGLIHVSELSDVPVRHPSEAVRAGQTVTVEIIALDPDRQRLGLSLKRVPEHLRHVEPAVPDADPTADEPTEVASSVESDAPDESGTGVDDE
ncbi:MAG: S1 RNA-binding domain-containing protein [Ardenticatenales bacterium]|nr:S1 RNA-binding domain-containing protein [Ardenticatenales bacterium]